tara:strand:- start:31087 stop:32367 length:1281 start_codon:yes stop_codon:yes gene_type:complete
VNPPPPVADRSRFISALEAAITLSSEHGEHTGLLLIDLWNLRVINHRHGFEIGDYLLRETQQQLQALSKLPDNVYRVSNKTYAFLLPRLTHPAFVALAVNRVQRTLEESLIIDDDILPVDLRLGLAVSRGSTQSALAMLVRAEGSLAQTRQGKPLQIDEAIQEPPVAERGLPLEQRFAEALYDNAFELHFQPKIDLRTGRVYGAEALIRWHLTDHGYVPPEELIALALASGRSYELTRWVINRALRYQREWKEDFTLPLAINLPADLVSSPDLANMLQSALAIWGTDPASVTVEITEGAVIEDKEAGFHNLEQLRSLGLGLSIDDFGTGFSSLSYFKEIPATEIKIDRSFIMRLLDDEQDQNLVKIIIDIGHLFNLDVVAEGVEDSATLDMLRALGCDIVQGFLFARPMPEAELRAWLRGREILAN